LVKVKVTPLTVNCADSPVLSPFSGLPSTLYSEVPSGQLRLTEACAARPKSIHYVSTWAVFAAARFG
jgi:hypothetical protein